MYNMNFGAIFENAIAQQLTAGGYPLYYYNSNRQGEVDFLNNRNHSNRFSNVTQRTVLSVFARASSPSENPLFEKRK